jgi:hypothetical protein
LPPEFTLNLFVADKPFAFRVQPMANCGGYGAWSLFKHILNETHAPKFLM